MSETKGFIVVYVNINDTTKINTTIEECINISRKQNENLIKKFADDGYETLFMPCFNESCRVNLIKFSEGATI